MAEGIRVAVLGLGEAGSAIAQDLVAAGARVVGYDPEPKGVLPGVAWAGSEAEAAAGADVVLSVNWARVALEVAQRVAPVLTPGQVYADLNTASPKLKRSLAEVVAPTGALFVDVALMSPVPGRGLSTPSLASGPGAEAYARALGPLGARVEVVGERPGDAATRKLLRSIFFKGMAAAVVEALEAAKRLGLWREVWENIAKTLAEADENTVGRLVEGSFRHAKRRRDEMVAAAELLEELGMRPWMARATAAHLEELSGSPSTPVDALDEVP